MIDLRILADPVHRQYYLNCLKTIHQRRQDFARQYSKTAARRKFGLTIHRLEEILAAFNEYHRGE